MSEHKSHRDPDDELMAQLAGLPSRDIGERRAAHLRKTARAAFVRSHERAKHRSWSTLRLYNALEPALVAILCGIYLGWALQTVIALHQ